MQGGKHDKQWSGIMFKQQANVNAVDLVALLGGTFLGESADLHLSDAPLWPLATKWRFLLGKNAWPFLSGVCDQPNNDSAAKFFTKMLGHLKRHGDLAADSLNLPHPWF